MHFVGEGWVEIWWMLRLEEAIAVMSRYSGAMASVSCQGQRQGLLDPIWSQFDENPSFSKVSKKWVSILILKLSAYL